MKLFPENKSGRTGVGLVAAALLLAACDGVQSTLEPNGPAAKSIADLWWVLFAVAAVVFVIVCALLAFALFHKGREEGVPVPLPTASGAEEQSEADGQRESETGEAEGPPREVRLDTAESDRRSVRWVVIGGVAVSGVILIGTLIFTLYTLGVLENRDEPPQLTIEVTGWQWWWEIHYFDAEGKYLFETANEIHIPVGERVRVRLRAGDVIHSFWVPQLAGKLDMIPGRVNEFWIEADDPGIYRGQCAEYCAGPHALMAFPLVAESEAEFRAWVARQRGPGIPPTEPLAARGREVFLTKGCAACHAVRGTPADGEFGPDLTHVASRLTLAAGTVPNTKGYMGGWIANPHEVKPGNKMPAVPLGSEEFIALLHYMQSLR